MMSGPEPDCTAEVTRAWIVKPSTPSRLILMPRSFWHCSLIFVLTVWSETGTKSDPLTQCSVVPWAKAGARPEARIAASPPVPAATAPPPESCKSRRRLMRVMTPLPVVLLKSDRCLGLHIEEVQALRVERQTQAVVNVGAHIGLDRRHHRVRAHRH